MCGAVTLFQHSLVGLGVKPSARPMHLNEAANSAPLLCPGKHKCECYNKLQLKLCLGSRSQYCQLILEGRRILYADTGYFRSSCDSGVECLISKDITRISEMLMDGLSCDVEFSLEPACLVELFKATVVQLQQENETEKMKMRRSLFQLFNFRSYCACSCQVIHLLLESKWVPSQSGSSLLVCFWSQKQESCSSLL